VFKNKLEEERCQLLATANVKMTSGALRRPMMEAARTSETSADVFQSTCRNKTAIFMTCTNRAGCFLYLTGF
jgi:hypothetical protein